MARKPSALGSYYFALAYRGAGRLEDARRSLAASRDAGLTASAIDAPRRAEYEALTASLAP